MAEPKNIKQIYNSQPPLKTKVDSWKALELDKELEVKYDPSKKTSVTHFDAIKADVNEDEGLVLNFLETQVKAEQVLKENIEALAGLQGLSFATEGEAKKEAEFRKKIKQQREQELREELVDDIKR